MGEVRRFIEITSANIKNTLDEVEKTYKVKLGDEENLLVKGNYNLKTEGLKKIKDALKEKQIYKFRIVTNNDN